MSEIAATFSSRASKGIGSQVADWSAGDFSFHLYHSLFISTSGDIIATGSDSSGCVVNVDGLSGKKFACAGTYTSIVQNADNSFTHYGSNTTYGGQTAVDNWDGISGVDLMAIGHSWAGIILSDGTVDIIGLHTDTGWNSITGAKDIIGGEYHYFVVRGDGTVYADLLPGKTNYGDVLTCVSSWTNIEKISGNNYSTFGIETDGTLHKDSFNSTVIPTAWQSYGDIIDLAATYEMLLIVRTDGTVESAGTDSDGIFAAVATWTDIVRIEMCYVTFSIIGLKSDGSFVSAGSNNYNQIDVGGIDIYPKILGASTANSAYVEGVQTRPASMYTDHAIMINRDGTCVGCGNSANSQIAVSGWAGIIQVTTADGISAGLQDDLTVVVTGLDRGPGALTVPPTWTDIVFITSGYQDIIGVDSNGDCYWAGVDGYNQLSDMISANGFSDIIEVAASRYFTVGLKSDGTCVFGGTDVYGVKASVEAWTDIIHIEAGLYNCAGVDSSGNAFLVGNDPYSDNARVSALTDVSRLTVDGTAATWTAALADGSCVNGGHPSFRSTISAWSGVTYIATAYFFSWGLSPSKDRCYSSNSDYGNTAGPCMEALTGLSDPDYILQTVYLADPFIQTYSPGLANEPPAYAQTFTHVINTSRGAFREPFSAETLVLSSLPGSFSVLIEQELPSFTATASLHELFYGGFVGTKINSQTIGAAEITYNMVSAETHKANGIIGVGFSFKSRNFYPSRITDCYLEDSNGLSISPLSITIQYSGRSDTTYAIFPLPYDDGKLFEALAIPPIDIKSGGDIIFSFSNYFSDDYIGGNSQAFILTCRGFDTMRLPASVSTPVPIDKKIFTGSEAIIIAGAFDIVPGDVVTAGDNSPITVSAASIIINNKEPRSIIYG